MPERTTVDEQTQGETTVAESTTITLTTDQYYKLLRDSRPGVLEELRGILRDVHGWVNYHMVYSALLTWELIFYDKHAADQSPDSLIEIIKQLLAAAGGA